MRRVLLFVLLGCVIIGNPFVVSAQEDHEYDDEEYEEEEDCIVTETGETICSSDDRYHSCRDEYDECEDWAMHGECLANEEFMNVHCPVSCGSCENHISYDANEWGVPQEVLGDRTLEIVSATRMYMNTHVFVEDEFLQVRNRCYNHHAHCSLWASEKLCESSFMKTQCAPACQTCLYLDENVRCESFDNSGTKLWNDAGDLNRFFTKLTSENSLSILSKDPWIVQIDDFLTDDECLHLIDMAESYGFSRDKGSVMMMQDEEEEEDMNDTLSMAWCDDECMQEEATQMIVDRIEKLTNIPSPHSEYLQFLRYYVNDAHRDERHDHLEHEVHKPQGVRILTMWIFLNDPEGGGGIQFPRVDDNLIVTPKQGRVLIWPSVLDENPDAKDERLHYETLPVESGVKYAANAWIHQRDFRTPYDQQCH